MHRSGVALRLQSRRRGLSGGLVLAAGIDGIGGLGRFVGVFLGMSRGGDQEQPGEEKREYVTCHLIIPL